MFGNNPALVGTPTRVRCPVGIIDRSGSQRCDDASANVYNGQTDSTGHPANDKYQRNRAVCQNMDPIGVVSSVYGGVAGGSRMPKGYAKTRQEQEPAVEPPLGGQSSGVVGAKGNGNPFAGNGNPLGQTSNDGSNEQVSGGGQGSGGTTPYVPGGQNPAYEPKPQTPTPEVQGQQSPPQPDIGKPQGYGKVPYVPGSGIANDAAPDTNPALKKKGHHGHQGHHGQHGHHKRQDGTCETPQ